MWPVMMLLTAAALDSDRAAVAAAACIRSRSRRWSRCSPGTACGVASIAARSISGRGERRYVDVARFIASHTDPDAVILSVQHSGSLRLYADRLTLRYDVLDPLWLDRAVEYLQSIGRRPYFVLDGGEVDAFRQRFGARNRCGRARLAADGDARRHHRRLRSDRSPAGRVTAGDRQHARRRTRLCDAPQSWPPVLRMK